MKKLIHFALCIVILATVFLFAACGDEKPTVNLNDYVEITADGYDSVGIISISVDYDRLIEDNKKHLVKEVDQRRYPFMTPADVASGILFYQRPFELTYEEQSAVSNGQQVNMKWVQDEAAIKELKKILNVNFTCKDFVYTVEGLTPLTEIDLMEHLEVSYYGYDGEGSVYTSHARLQIGGMQVYVFAQPQNDENLSNGDAVHFVFDCSDEEYYTQQYGVRFVGTEGDVEVQGLPCYGHKKPQQIVESFSESSIENATTFCRKQTQIENGDVTAVEYLGAACYYNDSTSSVALLFHVENGVVPGGWYTYLVCKESMSLQLINDQWVTVNASKNELGTQAYQYYYEYIPFWNMDEVPFTFTYEDTRYVGHQTLESCMEALDGNVIYDELKYLDLTHRAVSESLQEQITEF